MTKIVKTESFHAAGLHELSPGLDPACHRFRCVPLRTCVFFEVPRPGDIEGKQEVLGFRCTQSVCPKYELTESPLGQCHQTRLPLLARLRNLSNNTYRAFRKVNVLQLKLSYLSAAATSADGHSRAPHR